jgi:hypothetical protein
MFRFSEKNIASFWAFRWGKYPAITETKYHRVLLTYARVLSSICGALNLMRMYEGPQGLKPRLPMSDDAWLEPIGFCLVALLILCELSFYFISPTFVFVSVWWQ